MDPERRDFLRAVALTVTAAALGCRKRDEGPVVGFSQMDNQGSWRIAETHSLRSEARARGYHLIVTDAQDQTAKQVGDVEDLIARRVRGLFVAPREYEGLEPAFEAARRAAVPVFLIDRAAAGVPGEDYVAFLGSDFVEQGRRCAAWLAAKLGGRGNVVELTGSPGSSVAADRARGFAEGIARHSGLRIVATQTAHFARAPGQRVTENLVQGLAGEVQAIYAHNDEMALGAIQALRSSGVRPGQDVILASIDGSRAALEAIVRGELGVSVESNPRFGPLAFDTLERHLAGEPVPPEVILEDRLFDASNAAAFLEEAY
jgi:ribose transport system substrate-binding protein